MSKVCENCGGPATVYAMGPHAGDWGGRYCDSHIPAGFNITDRLVQTVKVITKIADFTAWSVMNSGSKVRCQSLKGALRWAEKEFPNKQFKLIQSGGLWYVAEVQNA